jgi:Ni/Co efflux regulator RcnB
MRTPDVVTIDKGHGRLERRELWTVRADDLGLYLQQDFGWPRVRQVGWIRHFRRRTRERTWTEVATHTWISSVPIDRAGPQDMALMLRGHWAIENALHWVRDVSWGEDRLHGRAIGINLAAVRNTAINLIRTLGFAYIPDGWRHLSARGDYGWSALTTVLKK